MIRHLDNVKKVVILDLDDVIVDCAGLLNVHMNKRGSFSSVNEYREYNFPIYHDLGFDDMKDIIDSEDVYSNVRLISGAKDAVNKLVANGYDVNITTSRGAFDDAYNKTQNYLRKNGVNYTVLNVVDHRCEKKSDFYRHLVDESTEIFLVDDNVDNLLDAERHDVMAICVDKPWNIGKVERHHINHYPSLVDVVEQLINY